MSERKWRTREVIGLFFVLILGNLLHFVYDWTGQNAIAAAFAATNESTWEHMKLLAVPWIVWSWIEWLSLRKGSGNVLIARAIGLLAGLAAIPALFYTYQGILGQNIDWVNILIFQAAVLLAFGISRRVQSRKYLRGAAWQLLGALVLLLVWAAFILWSYRVPQLPLFADPMTGLAGRLP